MMKILRGIPTDRHSRDYAVVRSRVEVSRPRSPIKVRFDFPRVAECLCCGKTHYQFVRDQLKYLRLKGLEKILATASLVRSVSRTQKSLLEVESLSLASRFEDDDSRSLERRIASCVPISSINVWGIPADGIPRRDYFGPFLWRMLSPQANARAKLGAVSVTIDGVSSVMAPGVFSALAQSKIVKELQICDQWQQTGPWIEFALFSNVASHNIRNFRLDICDHTLQYLETILKHPDPVAYLDALRRNVDLRRHPINWEPTTVKINASSQVHETEFSWMNTTKTVYHGKLVAECHVVGKDQVGMVPVLIPGVGFGRVRRCDVLCEEPTQRRDVHSIQSLAIGVCYGHSSRYVKATIMIQEVLKLIGAPITELTVDGVCCLLDIGSVFASCPQLKKLTLENVVVSMEELLLAPTAPQLQMLTLRRVEVTSITDRFTAGTIIPRVYPQLRSLHVDIRDFARSPTSTTHYGFFERGRSRTNTVEGGEARTHSRHGRVDP